MDSPYILIIHCTNSEQEKNIKDYIASNVKRMNLKSKSVNAEHIELNYEVRLKDDNSDFVNELNTMPGVIHVVLVSYNGDYMG